MFRNVIIDSGGVRNESGGSGQAEPALYVLYPLR